MSRRPADFVQQFENQIGGLLDDISSRNSYLRYRKRKKGTDRKIDAHTLSPNTKVGESRRDFPTFILQFQENAISQTIVGGALDQQSSNLSQRFSNV